MPSSVLLPISKKDSLVSAEIELGTLPVNQFEPTELHARSELGRSKTARGGGRPSTSRTVERYEQGGA